MAYRYFECQCGNKFNEFTTDSNATDSKVVDPSRKALFLATCPNCRNEVESKWNDPKGIGTKLYFDYMER